MELTAAETLPSFSTEELENPPERRIAVLTSGGGPRRAVSSTSLSQTSSREKTLLLRPPSPGPDAGGVRSIGRKQSFLFSEVFLKLDRGRGAFYH